MVEFHMTHQDWIDFASFLSKKSGLETNLRAGETRRDLEERVKRASRKMLHIRVEVREEEGRFFVWRV
jgi:hypothetical protein